MLDPFECTIFSYSRKQALEDGILIDVTKMAKEAGMRFDTAVTVTLWNAYIEPSEALKDLGQSAEGRLWDVLVMLYYNAHRTDNGCMLFDVLFQMAPGKPPVARKIKAMVGPGDTDYPVITILGPEEN
ncbi:MAG: hypothetical protein GW949_05685 [Spirochaetales bacterium]|nr:hypothetical protein [Spirochaetales bacterium]